MKKIAEWIVHHKKLIIVIFTALLILSVIAVPFVVARVNSDITAYLPEGTLTTDGQKFLKETFGINGDIMLGIKGKPDNTYEQNFKYVQGIVKKINGINTEDNKEITTLIWSGTLSMLEGNIPAEKYEQVAKIFCQGENRDNFIVMMTIKYGPSTPQAFTLLEKVEKILIDEGMVKGEGFEIGGMTNMAREVFASTIGEVPKYAAVAILVVVVILLLTSKSFIEPLILMLTLGVSIVLNLGSNIIFPSNSIITFAASSILQLGLAMDYAIFLTHSYLSERKHSLTCDEALSKAIPKTLSTVAASALTTMGGFVALYFMQFTIGADLGGVLTKGIFLSMVTVIVLQPALIGIFRKVEEKTQHKSFKIKLRKPVKTVIKYRTVVVVMCVLVLVPAFIGQLFLDYNYLKFSKEQPNPSELQQCVDVMSNQLIVSVPLDKTEEGIAKHKEFLAELESTGKVKNIMGLFTMMDINSVIDLSIAEIGMRIAGMNYLKQSEGKDWYTMYSMTINTKDIEGEETIAALETVQNVLKNNYGEKATYMTGMGQAVRDFAAITPVDFNRVSLFSMIVILIILIFTLRSVKHSVLLVLLIELGIWINLSIQAMSGQINFMSYIIISSIQLGATVDYAILITVRYRELKKRMLPAQAAYQATTNSAMSIITSAMIIGGACLSVFFISSNAIVAEITYLIARGAAISAVLVLFVLPAVFAFVDGGKKKFEGDYMVIPKTDKLRSRRNTKRLAESKETEVSASDIDANDDFDD